MKKYLLLAILLPLHATAQVSQNLTLQPGPTITLPTGANLSALAIADFNTDSRGDIAVCQKGLNSIGVYLQTATGAYPASANGTYATGIAPTGLVATALSNVVSRPAYDLVAISGPGYLWTLLQNSSNGQGAFTSIAPVFPFGFNNTSTSPRLATAYLNRDNYSDFIYTYDTAPYYGVVWQNYLGGGNIRNSNEALTPTYAPSSFALNDFDRDGYTDVVFTNTAGNAVGVVIAAVVTSTMAPDWAFPTTRYDLTAGISQPVDIATGDVNRDLQPDLAIANAGSSSLTVYLNLGSYQFGSAAAYPLSAAPRRVLVEDLNGDGYPELLAITADNKLQVFRHTGATGVPRYGTPITLPTGTDPTLLHVADIDGDQLKDIVVGCVGDNTVRVYLNRSLTGLATTTPQLAGVSVFPNPANDQLSVSVLGPQEPLQATLLDALGRSVRETTLLPTDRTLPIADLPRGLYVLRLTGKAGSSVVRVVLQ